MLQLFHFTDCRKVRHNFNTDKHTPFALDQYIVVALRERDKRSTVSRLEGRPFGVYTRFSAVVISKLLGCDSNDSRGLVEDSNVLRINRQYLASIYGCWKISHYPIIK